MAADGRSRFNINRLDSNTVLAFILYAVVVLQSAGHILEITWQNVTVIIKDYSSVECARLDGRECLRVHSLDTTVAG